jgi:hypothetical protein
MSNHQLVAEAAIFDNTTLKRETDIHAPGGIRTHNPSNRAAADPRSRPHGHWDRLQGKLVVKFWTKLPEGPSRSG